MTPINYHILVALGDGPKHGYAIMREIDERTEGSFRVLPGTLYSTIKKMLAASLIKECAPPKGDGAVDERRRYYRIEPLGRRQAADETERMAALVQGARRKGFAAAR